MLLAFPFMLYLAFLMPGRAKLSTRDMLPRTQVFRSPHSHKAKIS